MGVRVTRLGLFVPIGQLFSLGQFFYITLVAHIFGQYFSTVKVMHWFLQSTYTYIGRFFTDSSGHPDENTPFSVHGINQLNPASS
jgi:hypothetical protein